jgi:hypothetical protein
MAHDLGSTARREQKLREANGIVRNAKRVNRVFVAESAAAKDRSIRLINIRRVEAR